MSVKIFFQLVKPVLANLYSIRFQKYFYMCSMNLKKIFFYFADEYQKYSECYADSKSIEKVGKKCTQKKLFAENFCKLEL